MQDSFDYLCVKECLDSISIGDTGNTNILANNDNASCWYLKTETYMGTTTITQFGPLVLNGNLIDRAGKFGFNYNQISIEYNEKRIHKIIDKFLNDTSRQITQVIEIEEDEFLYKLEEMKRQL